MQAHFSGHGSPWSARPLGGRGHTRPQGVLLIETAPLCEARRGGEGRAYGRPAQDMALPAVVIRRATALERALPKGWRVFHAVHHGVPSIAGALWGAQREGVERLIVMPMRPIYSDRHTGDILRELYRCLAESESTTHIDVRPWWHDDGAYVDAHARLVHAFVSGRGLSPQDTSLVFWTAPGARPLGAGERGGAHEAAQRIVRRLGWDPARSSTVVANDAGEGALRASPLALSNTVLVSLSHMSSGPQFDADLRALMSSVDDNATVHVCPPPDDADLFVKALVHLARRGRQVASEDSFPPLFSDHGSTRLVEPEVEALVMVGVCARSSLGRGQGPALHYCEHDELRRFKRPHAETLDLLPRLEESLRARECFIWNTCSRYELYSFLTPGMAREQQHAAARLAASEMFGPGAECANLLVGRDAWHHALRTASGLNSALVGDAEVVEQLRAGRAAAQYAGTAGELIGAFVDHIAASVRTLRGRTSWGRFEHRYCDAALASLEPTLRHIVPHGRCLVIGGSTTSCSALETLVGRFAVPTKHLSLIYRGHRRGTLTKRLHAAAGDGSVTVVEDYSEPRVLEAIVNSDLVVFAVDQRQPVCSLEMVAKGRVAGAGPLTILDFNTFGSVALNSSCEAVRLVDAKELDAGVECFNSQMLVLDDFVASVRHAESWIASEVDAAPRPGKRSGPAGDRSPCRVRRVLTC